METPDKNIIDYLKASKKPAVEENFFAQFETSMLQKIGKEARKTKIRKLVFWSTGIAASIIVFISITLFTKNNEALQSVSNGEILAYVEDHLEDFDSESLLEDGFKVEEILTTKTSEKIENKTEIQEEKQIEKPLTFQDLNAEEIYNYLENEDIDLEDL